MKSNWKFSANICSVCGNVDLTIGDNSFGGIRYCEECLHLSFGWFSARQATKDGITRLFTEKRQDKRLVKQLAQMKGLSPEEVNAISIGEAKNRMFRAEIEEARRP